MPRPADPLHAPRDAARQAHLHGQVGRADVDAQFQAGARHHRANLARLQARLDRPAALRVERRVMRGNDGPGVGVRLGSSRAATVRGRFARRCSDHRSLTVAARLDDPAHDGGTEVVRDLLRERARVGEDHRGAMPVDDPAQTAEQSAITQSAVRALARTYQALDGECRRRRAGGRGRFKDAATSVAADQEPDDGFVRAAGGRKADTARVSHRLRRDALERYRQVGATLRRRHGVELVDDQMVDGPPVGPPAILAQQQRQALGRRDQDVRGVVAELAALVRRGIAGADSDPDRAGLQPDPGGDARKRPGQVAFDVVVEAPQGRHVDAAQTRFERARLPLAE